jgi:hypothetical protein
MFDQKLFVFKRMQNGLFYSLEMKLLGKKAFLLIPTDPRRMWPGVLNQ